MPLLNCSKPRLHTSVASDCRLVIRHIGPRRPHRPGVHDHNYRKLMNSVLNLDELARKSRDELAAILGQMNGKLLHEFLHREA